MLQKLHSTAAECFEITAKHPKQSRKCLASGQPRSSKILKSEAERKKPRQLSLANACNTHAYTLNVYVGHRVSPYGRFAVAQQLSFLIGTYHRTNTYSDPEVSRAFHIVGHNKILFGSLL